MKVEVWEGYTIEMYDTLPSATHRAAVEEATCGDIYSNGNGVHNSTAEEGDDSPLQDHQALAG